MGKGKANWREENLGRMLSFSMGYLCVRYALTNPKVPLSRKEYLSLGLCLLRTMRNLKEWLYYRQPEPWFWPIKSRHMSSRIPFAVSGWVGRDTCADLASAAPQPPRGPVASISPQPLATGSSPVTVWARSRPYSVLPYRDQVFEGPLGSPPEQTPSVWAKKCLWKGWNAVGCGTNPSHLWFYTYAPLSPFLSFIILA